MATFEELDALSSQELHDRAIARARHHLDVAFFWSLVRKVPAAEAAAGDIAASEGDIEHPAAAIAEVLHEDAGVMDALRPVFIDYLLEHPDA